jgi:5-methyltetrahydropteroyltriglutamate--homocysteine methyltransferase
MDMLSCYLSGMLPRPRELIDATRAYDRGRLDKAKLEKTFEEATMRAVNAQLSAGLSYVTDGMFRWQDLLRPFAENLHGIRIGGLTRWFNNNTFYRKPVVVSEIQRKKSILHEITLPRFLPKNSPWKAIMPAPYTFAELSENQFYKNKTELMFEYAKMIRQEIEDLVHLGFKYVQLSDPALVYRPTAPKSEDELSTVKDALQVTLKGLQIESCLQTFFGDFSQIMPEALDFPVDHLGVDLYETDSDKLKQHSFGKGVALGLADSRSSLVEDESELVNVAKEILNAVDSSEPSDVFVCPNCDLDFLPWNKAVEKMKVISHVAKLLREELHG